MTFSRRGLLYKIAYGLKDPAQRPIKGNLCSFFWRIVFMFFLGWPFFLVVNALWLTIAFVPALLFAQKPRVIRSFTQDITKSYENWPMWDGMSIKPWSFVLVLAVVYGCFVDSTVRTSVLWLVGVTIMAAIAALILVFLFDLPNILKKLEKKWEGYKLLAEFVKAKREKICPQITFK